MRMKATLKRWAAAAISALMLCGGLGLIPDRIVIENATIIKAEAANLTENDDYPTKYKFYPDGSKIPKGTILDEWNFYNRHCTSFVAWRLNSQNGVAFHDGYGGVEFGNANTWGNAAKQIGIAVDMNPAPGSVWWSGNGKYGHVAWVREVNGSKVVIEEYNHNSNGEYNIREVDNSSASGYIHIKDIASITDSYVKEDLGAEFYAQIENVGIKEQLSNIQLNVQGADAIGTNNQIWKFTRQSDGSYSIISYEDGCSMDVADGKDETGTNIQMMPYDGNTAQRFFIFKVNGNYVFRPVFAKNVLDMDMDSYNLRLWSFDASLASMQFEIHKVNLAGSMPEYLGAEFYAQIENVGIKELLSNIQLNVQGADAIGTNNQIWKFTRQGDGSYSIISYEDGCSMDVSDGKDEIGANIQMMPYDGNTAQRFFIFKVNGNYVFRPVFAENVLDMDMDSYNLRLWSFDSSLASMQFEIHKVNLDSSMPEYLGAEFYAHIENVGIKELLSNIQLNVQGADAIGTNNQIWKFTRQGDGSYSIISYEDGYSMDVADGKDEIGANIQMMPYVGNTAQRFFIFKVNGNYVFRPVFAENVLDMDVTSYDLRLWNYDASLASMQFFINTISLTNTVTFDANGGTVTTKSKSVEFGKKYGTLPTPTKSNSDFLGWYTAKTGGTKITANTEVRITENQTLYAQWSSTKTYTVIFNSNGGTGSMSNQTLTLDATAKLNANAFKKDGYVFLGWSTDKSATTAQYSDQQSVKNLTNTAGGKVTLYAIWSMGDINQDGKVNIADAVLLKKWLIAEPNTVLPDWKAGDMNNDGMLNAVDLTLIKKLLMLIK